MPHYVCRVPYAEGARRIVASYDADPSLAKPNEALEQAYDTLINLGRSAP